MALRNNNRVTATSWACGKIRRRRQLCWSGTRRTIRTMKQHIVSKCYLKAWCDPSTPKGQEPYIWLISRDGSEKTRRAPHKSLTKTNAYTEPSLEISHM